MQVPCLRCSITKRQIISNNFFSSGIVYAKLRFLFIYHALSIEKVAFLNLKSKVRKQKRQEQPGLLKQGKLRLLDNALELDRSS